MPELRRTLLERVAALTPGQRRTLAERLEPSGPRALIAYVVTSGSGSVSADELRAYLRDRVPEHMIPSAVVSVAGLPRTPGGKLDRGALGDLEDIPAAPGRSGEFVAPRSKTEELLAGIWREVLGLDAVSIHDDFFEVGGDSLLSIRVLSRAARHGIRIDPESFFEKPTIAAMTGAAGRPSSDASVPAEQGVVTGDAGLTPIQHWFFDHIRTDRQHWNQSWLLTVPSAVTVSMVESAVRTLVTHHDGLRTRFEETEGSARQVLDPVPSLLPLRLVDVGGLGPEARADRIAVECRAEQQRARLHEGRLARFAFFDCGDEGKRLLIVVHHLLVDAYSWGILLEDLSALLGQALSGQPLALPPKTRSVIEWWRAVAAAAGHDDIENEVRPWLDMPEARAFPVDRAGADAENSFGRADSIEVSLGPDESSALLDQVAAAPGATARDSLLAAFLLAWHDHTGLSELLVDCEGHGRDSLPGGPDVSRTVGWFTTVFPVTLQAGPGPDETLRGVSARFLALGRKGASHGMARYLDAPPAVRSALTHRARPRVLFNYLGRAADPLPPGTLVRLAPEARGPERSPDGERAYLIEVDGGLRDGRLTFQITYSPAFHTRETVATLGGRFEARLREMARTAVAPDAPFALSGLDAGGLARAAALLDAEDEGEGDEP